VHSRAANYEAINQEKGTLLEQSTFIFKKTQKKEGKWLLTGRSLAMTGRKKTRNLNSRGHHYYRLTSIVEEHLSIAERGGRRWTTRAMRDQERK